VTAYGLVELVGGCLDGARMRLPLDATDRPPACYDVHAPVVAGSPEESAGQVVTATNLPVLRYLRGEHELLRDVWRYTWDGRA